jgi:hypothetical protein
MLIHRVNKLETKINIKIIMCLMLEKEVSKPIGLSWKSKDQLQED